MARTSRQKLKILYLYKILHEKTDENHPMSVQEMIEELRQYDITAERKSIYDDLEALRTYGTDIIQVRGKTTGYYVGRRLFEMPELRVLMDCVQSSKFISPKKTETMLCKLGCLLSEHQTQSLKELVCVRNRVKSRDENAYYSVDKLARAMDRDCKVSFRFYHYYPNKERIYCRNGRFYRVSPFALLCDEDRYYLLAWDSETESFHRYRVDRMSALELVDEPREGHEAFAAVNISDYAKRVFEMFPEEEQMVTLRFDIAMTEVVLDRFGWDVPFYIENEEQFSITVPVQISPKFFGWLFGLGRGVEVVGPESVREAYRARLAEVSGQYE